MDGWELAGHQELPVVWAHRARCALGQLRLRAAGQPHTRPDAGGRWDVSVRHRLRITGAQAVPGQLAPHWAFTPAEMFVDVSTSGIGSLLLFGAGPVETDSKRYDFAVSVGGVVVFDQLDPGDQVPDSARGPVLEAARLAFKLRTEADRQLTDETTGSRAEDDLHHTAE
ncbi:hypothetical protein [Citricoccus alkalitolerans]|uniref:PilZ domain-containing protein n=1 Tax=Citricoccus alkalitolerans TaxID=246603 RepID=A0ABV8XYS1_9MICC